VSKAMGRSRYSLMVWVFMAALLEWLRCVEVMERARCPIPAPVETGLGAWDLLLEGFCEALRAQVAVPLLGELFVLVVKRRVEDVMAVSDET